MKSCPQNRKRSASLDLRAFDEIRPQILVNVALACIFLIDAGLTLVNIVQRVLVWLDIVKAASGLPPKFSPSHPPPITQWPLTHLYCRFVHVYNICTGYDESLRAYHDRFTPAPRNDWVRDWACWNGHGHCGEWSAATPTRDSDSRSPCPGLNILATHGIVSATGRRISASQLVASVSRTYGIAPTMAFQLYSPLFARFAQQGHVFALQDVGAVNVIEHDASLLRPDFSLANLHQDPNAMTRPHQDLINRLFPLRPDKKRAQKRLTHADFASALRNRRQECSLANNVYSSTLTQSLIGAGSCCLMLNVFGGRLADLRQVAGSISADLPGLRTTKDGQAYGYERLPSSPNWQPATASRYFGMTIFEALFTTFKIEVLARTS